MIAVVSLVGFVVWELRRREPLLDLRMFKQRNFAIGVTLIMLTGVIMYGTTQFIPQLLQEVLGYTASSAGKALTAGGLATLVAMPIAGILSDKVQPRFLIAAALAMEAIALWHMTHLNTNMSFADAAWARVWQAFPIPFLFIPLTNAAYVGLRPAQSGQASALLNVARNLGGSIGISSVQAFIVHRQQFYQSRHVETLNPLNPDYSSAIDQISALLGGHGRGSIDAMQSAAGVVYQGVLKQASMLAYIDCFWVLMVFVLIVLPIVLLMRSTPTGGRAHA